MVTFLLVLSVPVTLAMAGFCAGVETGFLSLSRGRVTHLAREGSRAARRLAVALADLPRTMTTLLIGNNLAAVAYSSVSAALCQRLFPGSAAAQTAWSVVAAFTMLYVSEFLPKLFCSARPLRRMLSLAGAWRIFAVVMGPFGGAVARLAGFFMRRGAPREKVTTGDLLRILEDRKDGVRLTDFESALISRILVLRKKGQAVTAEALLRALDDDDSERSA